MSEQRASDEWFEAVRIPTEDPPPPLESWEKCGHRHPFASEAFACAKERGEGWSAAKARRGETHP